MRAHKIAGKFQGATVVASLLLLATAAQAASPSTQAPHKKTRKAHAHHTMRTASTLPLPPVATPSPAPVVAPVVAPIAPSSSEPTPLASDRSLEPGNPDHVGPDADPIRHRVALTLNPIPLVIGRFGANIEVMLASHHAVVASGFLQTYSSAVMHVLVPQADMSNLPSPLFGGEVGYRLYSGREGPEGFFAGPSLVMMPFAYPHVGSDLRAEMVAFETYGAALDVGAQAVVTGGLTIGGGIGVQYLAYTPPASIAPPPGVTVPSYPEPHVLPRVLLAAGWAF